MSFCSFLLKHSITRWLGRLFGCKAEPPPPPPDQVWTATDGATSVSVSRRFAGAIFSIKYGGQEFVNCADHGRLVQTALQLDNGGEGNNPTEAGSVNDGAGPTSSSIATITSGPNWIRTNCQLAYWIPYQGNIVSDITLTKLITVTGNKIVVDIALNIPSKHGAANIEVLTGYLIPGREANMVVSAPDTDRVSVQHFPDCVKWSATKGYGPLPAGTHSWSVTLTLS